jgi:hypothetical protein
MSRRGRSRQDRDAGTATVEFVLVGLLMMVPITYGLLTALQVQRTAFAAVEAARAGARAFITAPSSSAGRQRAQQAVDLALRDQGVPAHDGQLRITCSTTPCLTPGGTIGVAVSSTVYLGWLPTFLRGGAGGTVGIPVQAVHVETVDPFEPGRP